VNCIAAPQRKGLIDFMGEQPGVQTLERAFGLLETLSRHRGGMHLLELSRESGLHKSTVHRLLASMISLGYVQKAEDADGKYRLSLKLFEMAGRVVENIDVLEAARGALEDLRDSAQEAVHLVVRDSNHIVYVQKLESRTNSYHLFSRIGMRRPLYCTAAGKSILATLSNREVSEIWNQSDIKQHTGNTITELNALYRELDDIRGRGYALDNEENELGVRCIAAALRDFTGQSGAAFSISAPIVRMQDDRVAALSAEVLATAKRISADLGYRERGEDDNEA